MRAVAFFFVVVFLLFTACASLHIQPTDSTGTKVTKALARVPVAIFTCGLSEMWHLQEGTMESWIGHHESDLFMSWGAPDAVLEDGSGGHILVYTENRMHVSNGEATTTSSGNAYGQVYGNQVYVNSQVQSYTTYTPAQVQQWKVYRQFRVNSAGQIIKYSWRGL